MCTQSCAFKCVILIPRLNENRTLLEWYISYGLKKQLFIFPKYKYKMKSTLAEPLHHLSPLVTQNPPCFPSNHKKHLVINSILYRSLLLTHIECVFVCVCWCACGFSCVSFMTAAQQEGNTHSILWPSRVLTSLPWQHRLMLSDRSDLPLTEIRLQALHLPSLSLFHLQSYSYTHTHMAICPHTCS